MRTVAGRLGHADASVTLRVYAHPLEERERELASFLGSAVLGPVHGGPELDEADPPAPAELEGAGQLSPASQVLGEVLADPEQLGRLGDRDHVGVVPACPRL